MSTPRDEEKTKGYTPPQELRDGPRKALETFSKERAESDRSLGGAMRDYFIALEGGSLDSAVDALKRVKDGLSKFVPNELVSFYTTTLALNTVELFSEDKAQYDAVRSALGRFGINRKWGKSSEESPAKSIISSDAPTLNTKARGDLIQKMSDKGLFDSSVYFGPSPALARALKDAQGITEAPKPTPPKVPPVK